MAQDWTVYINPNERLHIIHTCGSETFKHSSLPRSLTLAKPAAQQMMVGGVPEERKVEMGEFLCFQGVLLKNTQILCYK